MLPGFLLLAKHAQSPEEVTIGLICAGIGLIIAIITAINKTNNVNWRNGVPYCPNCNKQISMKSSRPYCRACGYNLVQLPGGARDDNRAQDEAAAKQYQVERQRKMAEVERETWLREERTTRRKLWVKEHETILLGLGLPVAVVMTIALIIAAIHLALT